MRDVTPLNLEWINLEFCSSCNLRCKWCSLDHDKPSQFMSTTLLGRVLDDIISDPGQHPRFPRSERSLSTSHQDWCDLLH